MGVKLMPRMGRQRNHFQRRPSDIR